MYEEFFGLAEKPFSIQPDPAFLYWGRAHRLAYAMLEYGVLNHAGISVVTGEVGCGKTTLIHRLLDQLSDTHSVALLSNIQQGRGDLLSWVLMGYGRPFAGKSHVELFADLQEFFISEYSKGRRVVLIIDEAQNLSVDQLEEIRMLSNINAGKDQLLQLILVGQPQLKDILNREDMLQLAQRVGSDFHLTPLSRDEVDAYVDTRLTIAGARAPIFTSTAIDRIAEHSRGVPRVINIICDTALVYAFSSQSRVVDVDTIDNVIRDKSDYGVFGLAADQRTALRAGPAAPAPSAPRLLVNEDQAPLRATRRAEPPSLRAVGDDDQPRMPAAPRNKPRAASMRSPEAASSVAADPGPQAALHAPTAHAGPQLFAADSEADASGDLAAPDHEVQSAPPPPKLRAAPATAQKSVSLETTAPVDVPSRPPVVGVVVVAGSTTPVEAIESARGADAVAFVAEAADEAALAAARPTGADTLAVADKALTPGRARNAGYRQVKKRLPGLAYVQFVEAGVRLDPGWLAEATRFLERRPEVVAVEGRLDIDGAEDGLFARLEAFAANGAPGEAEIAGQTLLVRADAFEAAGGFRGDLLFNETRDLCIRLRRRGGHVWRLDRRMAARAPTGKGLGGFWARAVRRGAEYAHGAALHGQPPDRLFVGERSAALIWGLILPILIVLTAAGGAIAAYFLSPFINPALVAGVVLGAGCIVYLVYIAALAAMRRAESGALAAAIWSGLAHVGEAFGVIGHSFGLERRRRAER